MADTRHGHHGHAGADHPGVGTEDVNIIAVSKFAIGLTILCVASAFLIWGVFAYLRHQTEAIQKARHGTPGLNLDVRRRPPEPALQETPILDLEDMRVAEDAILNGYSKSGDTVHIPIGQAMDIVAKQNLPSRPQPPAQTPLAGDPRDSGMGYTMQQVGGPLNPNREQPPVQREEIHGTGNMRDGRQAGGPPTPPVPQQHQGKQQ